MYGKKDHKYRHATFRSAEFKRNQVIVAFDYAEGDLVCPDGAMRDWRCAMPRCVSSRLRGMIDEAQRCAGGLEQGRVASRSCPLLLQ